MREETKLDKIPALFFKILDNFDGFAIVDIVFDRTRDRK